MIHKRFFDNCFKFQTIFHYFFNRSEAINAEKKHLTKTISASFPMKLMLFVRDAKEKRPILLHKPVYQKYHVSIRLFLLSEFKGKRVYYFRLWTKKGSKALSLPCLETPLWQRQSSFLAAEQQKFSHAWRFKIQENEKNIFEKTNQWKCYFLWCLSVKRTMWGRWNQVIFRRLMIAFVICFFAMYDFRQRDYLL